MRKYVIGLLLLTNLLVPMGNQHLYAENKVESTQLTDAMIDGESAILVDRATGAVLYEKNAYVRQFPASITKIATGIYAIENGDPADIVTVSKRARNEEGTRVYLAEGEQVPLGKLEYGLLMHSGNDAATAIAEHLEGSNEAFAEKLNQFLETKIGVFHTHFTNPHGLHDPNHYTTAADMAKIASYAMKNSTFREISATKRLPWDGKEWKTELVNHNKMLWRYEGATGLKNGFTDQARHTLVISAKRGNTELIAVTMRTRTSESAYKDTTAMLDYGLAHFETKQIATAGQTYTESTASASERADTFFTDKDLFATVPIGSTLIQHITPDGHLQVKAGLISQEFVLLRKELPPIPANQAETQTDEQKPSTFVYYLLFGWWLLLNVLLVLYMARRMKRRRVTIRQRREFSRGMDW